MLSRLRSSMLHLYPLSAIIASKKVIVEAWKESSALGKPTTYQFTGAPVGAAPLDNAEQRNKNLRWLRTHFRPLIEVGRLPFNNADMWQLHQYYFSPPYFDSEGDTKELDDDDEEEDAEQPQSMSATEELTPTKKPDDIIPEETSRLGSSNRGHD